jgi:DNA invertase Pin-like site-specific DNA recombinase
MVITYIRPDKNFDAAGEQLQYISSYAVTNNFVIDDEFIDYTSQNKPLSERLDVTKYFRSQTDTTLLVYDVWVLSTNIEDLVQMFSCLLKNKFTIHFIKQSVIITQQSSAAVALGLIDQLRQTLQNESKKVIGRPKGSKSNSKFDKHLTELLVYIKEKKSISEIARVLGVSRSSLKDYVESRELKQVAFSSLVPKNQNEAEEEVINTITCPN